VCVCFGCTSKGLDKSRLPPSHRRAWFVWLDPLLSAAEINDVADVEKHFPGELEKIRVWFRDYKTPDGWGGTS
jgi:inorganic pyrophosphatase